MEIRAITTDHRKAPVSGMSTYVIVEESGQHVTLFHPWTLTEFTMDRAEYTRSVGPMLWPQNQTPLNFNVKELDKAIQDKVNWFRQKDRHVPIRTVTRVRAELTGRPVTEIEEATLAIPTLRPPAVRTVRRYQLIKKIKLADFKGRRREMLEVLSRGPATVTGIAAGITYVPKLRVAGQDLGKAKEREILWVLRIFLAQKLVRITEE